jgi:hypothetical protein
MHLGNVILVAFALSTAAFAQPNATLDTPFQVRYAANLNIGDSYIDITNTGNNGAPTLGPGFGGASGNICVNVYAFDPGEELISCCSCLITPDETVNLSAIADLTSKTLTGVIPTSITIKLLGTLAGTSGTGSSCTNSAAMVATASAVAGAAGSIVGGFAAWGTTLHLNTQNSTYFGTETPFTPSTLTTPANFGANSELASIGGRCAAILGNGSGFGVCTSCRAGALGATKQ